MAQAREVGRGPGAGGRGQAGSLTGAAACQSLPLGETSKVVDGERNRRALARWC